MLRAVADGQINITPHHYHKAMWFSSGTEKAVKSLLEGGRR